MSSASVELAKHVLLVFGIILALGAASAVLAQKLKIPDVVVFLLIGAAWSGVTGVMDIRADSALNQLVLILALTTSSSRWCCTEAQGTEEVGSPSSYSLPSAC
jgi:Kef-type K+ transport system membrane component KefB